MAKKRKKVLIPKLLLICMIISGIAAVVLRMLNRRLQVPEIGEIAGYAGTAFAISLILMIGLWIINQVNKK
ncbi:MAG: hypothetical protein HYZ42_02895 [Bacteroidetes bacterium]|nr:hypothetical protein [Bacteroidota bacterium]